MSVCTTSPAVRFSGFNPFPALRTSHHDTCLHHLPLPALRFSTHSALTLSLPFKTLYVSAPPRRKQHRSVKLLAVKRLNTTQWHPLCVNLGVTLISAPALYNTHACRQMASDRICTINSRGFCMVRLSVGRVVIYFPSGLSRDWVPSSPLDVPL